MEFSINSEKLAHLLNISTQSLELRLRRLIVLMGDVATPATAHLSTLDMAEAKLLGLMDLSTEEMRELKHELGMVEA
jgi:hypothetical protein